MKNENKQHRTEITTLCTEVLSVFSSMWKEHTGYRVHKGEQDDSASYSHPSNNRNCDWSALVTFSSANLSLTVTPALYHNE